MVVYVGISGDGGWSRRGIEAGILKRKRKQKRTKGPFALLLHSTSSCSEKKRVTELKESDNFFLSCVHKWRQPFTFCRVFVNLVDHYIGTCCVTFFFSVV